jgi:hypothetical protein
MSWRIFRNAACIVLILASYSPVLPAQKVSFGLITGSQLTGDFRSITCPDLHGFTIDPPPGCPRVSGASFSVADRSHRYILGPKLNVRFSPSFSVEVDALYRQIRTLNTSTFQTCLTFQANECTSVGPRTTTREEIDFSWEFPVLARYQRTGRKFSPFVEGGPSFLPAENRELYGFAAGGGVQFRVRDIRLSPALRYTHWVNNGRYLGFNPNQLQLVVGIDGPESEERVSVFGRKVSLGFFAGVALTDGLKSSTDSFTDRSEFVPSVGMLVLSGTTTSNANRTSPVIGIVTEVDLPKRLSLGFNALYRPLNSRDVTTYTTGDKRQTNFTVLTWEFPILLKHRFPIKADPFLEVGPALRASGNLNGASPSPLGATAGAGMEFQHRKIKLLPTLRFTHWAADTRPRATPTQRNQVEFLLGVRF